MSTIVKEVMTPTVISVREDTSYEDIAAALRDHRVSAVPVLDEAGTVIGIVSESDTLAKLALGISDERKPGVTGILTWRQLEKARAITAGDLMTSPVATASPDEPVEQAARIMYTRNVKRLPVIDAGGQLVGIVSRTDVLAVYGRSDEDIAEEIRTRIFAGEAHVEKRPFDLSVQSGIVTVYGGLVNPRQGRALVRAVRRVEGVVAVRDRLQDPIPEPDVFDVLARFPVD